MAETHKVYTSQPYRPEWRHDYDPPPLGGVAWFFFIIVVLVVVFFIFQRVIQWWESFGIPYSAPYKADKYYDYNTNTTKKTNMLATPKVNKWVDKVYKPKPVVPPRMFFTGRLDGQPVEWEGEPETKYLLVHERNRYYAQKGVSIAEQDDIEAKWKNDLYIGK